MLKGEINDKVLEVFNNSKGHEEMKTILSTLVQSLTGFKFYYSIPIKPAKIEGGPFIVNPAIDGSNGFKKELFADKFFINVAPEGPRLLLNINTFLTAVPIDQSQVISTPPAPPASKTTKKATKNKVVPEVLDQTLVSDVKLNSSLNEDLKLANSLVKEYEKIVGVVNPMDTMTRIANFLNKNFK